ncbi:DUF3015 domain-containing protein [Deferribacterales bacterium RsTz2092]|nr:hypothetical protein AGMMS49941_02050 [Deferribacterales bacterium]
MKKLLVVTILATFCSVALAIDKGNTGCGLGYMLWADSPNSKLKQLLATSTNATSTNQSTGITLDVRAFGCSYTPRVVSNEMSQFVQTNMDGIMRDVAVGHGETIDAMAKLLNVKDGVALGGKLQKNFSVIFPSSDVEYAYVADTIFIISNS